jgi:hypothetical protein
MWKSNGGNYVHLRPPTMLEIYRNIVDHSISPPTQGFAREALLKLPKLQFLSRHFWAFDPNCGIFPSFRVYRATEMHAPGATMITSKCCASTLLGHILDPGKICFILDTYSILSGKLNFSMDQISIRSGLHFGPSNLTEIWLRYLRNILTVALPG